MTAAADNSLPDQVRAACAWVAGEAELVRIEEGAIAAYARQLESAREPDGADPQAPSPNADRETRAAFAICLNAINFGSGWWPTIRKRPGLSGYSTIAAGVGERFREAGAWTAEELAAIDGAGGSAAALATELGTWSAFADTSLYRERPVPLFKRAQLATADLDRAGVANFPDRNRLTAFADNLVPHVLRLDGVLRLDRDLEAEIEAGELLLHGSPAEVELRACAVHAVELLAAAGSLSPAELDGLLWNRGRGARYKAVPRPRSRNTAY